jgi:MFS family permease
MNNKENLREYYKYNVFAFFNGFGGPTWGALTYYLSIAVAFLTFLKASSMQIGLVTAIFWAGFAIPQIWAAYVSETKTIKKGFMAKVVTLAGLAWIVLAVYIFITKASSASFTIWLFLILFLWSCSFTGMFMPANFSLLFKIIPSSRLGKLLGIIFAIQFGGLVIAGPVISTINRSSSEPMNYAIMFLLTGIIALVISLILLSIKEPEGDKIQGSLSLRAYLGKCFDIVKTDKTLSRFIIGKWLMSGHYIMLAFLLAYLIKERGFNPLSAGWFTSFHALGLFIGGFTITKIADIYGPKYMLLTSHLIAVIYTLIVWLIPTTSPVVIFVAFVITGLAQNSDNVGYTNMCLFCCPTIDKSSYVAVTNVGVNLLTVPLPIILGRLIDIKILTYSGMFTLILIMMVAAIIYILTIMKDPKAFLDMKAAAK